MPAISTILCPVDRSPISSRALAYAVAMAKGHQARVHVIEVLEQTAVPMPRGPQVFEFPDSVRQAALESLQTFAAGAVAAGVVDGVRLCQGRVTTEIQREAKACGADLIVLGTHGRSGFERVTLGSVAERILHRSPVPVLVVPPGDEHPADRPFRTVLCPTDFSEPGDAALQFARFVAQYGGTTALILVNVVEWPFGHTAGPDAVTELRLSLEAEARDRLDERAAAEPPSGRSVTTIVATGRPSREIVALARARLADLVVMGVSGRGAVDLALLGSTTHQVVRHAPCAVLTVPAKA